MAMRGVPRVKESTRERIAGLETISVTATDNHGHLAMTYNNLEIKAWRRPLFLLTRLLTGIETACIATWQAQGGIDGLENTQWQKTADECGHWILD